MLIKIGKEVIGLSKGTVSLSELRRGIVIVWQAVRSCFGSGIWVSQKPWLGSEKWKGNK